MESFIPGWDWDLPPKKKSRKKKGEKGSKKSANGSLNEGVSSSDTLTATGHPKIEEVVDEGDD